MGEPRWVVTTMEALSIILCIFSGALLLGLWLGSGGFPPKQAMVGGVIGLVALFGAQVMLTLIVYEHKHPQERD